MDQHFQPLDLESHLESQQKELTEGIQELDAQMKGMVAHEYVETTFGFMENI